MQGTESNKITSSSVLCDHTLHSCHCGDVLDSSCPPLYCFSTDMHWFFGCGRQEQYSGLGTSVGMDMILAHSPGTQVPVMTVSPWRWASASPLTSHEPHLVSPDCGVRCQVGVTDDWATSSSLSSGLATSAPSFSPEALLSVLSSGWDCINVWSHLWVSAVRGQPTDRLPLTLTAAPLNPVEHSFPSVFSRTSTWAWGCFWTAARGSPAVSACPPPP
nr:uncharacterized protein LOC105868370 isoform X2 [Microcebus murinus]